jgi:response regulator RpfG family c-di-GMP phosphodiesterase
MTMSLKDIKILFVDDDQSILSGFQRVFRKHFDVYTSPGAEKAYEIIMEDGPFAIIVSDMHMPGIDGVQFLAKIKEMSPDTIRMMLTGNSDIQIAVDAVNEGHIFRFLTKPCPPDTLMKALLMGIQQYHLLTAERDLLEKTLTGSIQVLTDILSMTNPAAFSRAKRIKHYIVQITKMLEIENSWQYEVAAMLSQIGCVTIPLDTVEKYFEGVELSKTENDMIKTYPHTGKTLLHKIPRLENVSEMINRQHESVDSSNIRDPLKKSDPVALGAALLKASIDFDELICQKNSQEQAVRTMQAFAQKYNQNILNCLEKIIVPHLENAATKLMKITDVQNGMFLAESIKTDKGFLVVAQGHEINEMLKQRMINYSNQGIIKDTVRIVYNA